MNPELFGFSRYRQVLERYWKHFFIVGLLTLAGLAPLAVGILLAVLSSSVLVLLPACVVGGLFAGPALSGMVDAIFRGLRDCRDDWWASYKKQFRQNLRSSLLPGIVFSLFVGFAVFMGMLLYISPVGPGWGTLAVYLFSFVLASMLFATYWPQLVLFEQSNKNRLKNCLLFTLKYFLPTLGVGLLQTVWYAAAVLFMPWTAFLVPILGVWYLLFLVFFILYPRLDEAFLIEQKIEETFPGQIDRWEEEV